MFVVYEVYHCTWWYDEYWDIKVLLQYLLFKLQAHLGGDSFKQIWKVFFILQKFESIVW